MHKTRFGEFVAIINPMSAVYQFKVRVGVVLVVEDKLLLVRQNDRPFWVLPGGTLEPGEGLDACAIRELQEETRLDITIQRLLYVSDFIQPGPKQTIDVFFLAALKNPDGLKSFQLATDENLNEAGFFSLDEVSKMTVQPALAASRALRDWQNNWEAPSDAYLGSYTPDH